MSTTKNCSKCKEEKILTEFHRQPQGKFGRHGWCKTCACAAQRLHKRTIPKARKVRDNLKSRYGMTVDQVNSMLEAQNHTCGICQKTLSFQTKRVDHDHKTGKVRGLLCHRCNLMCGVLDNEAFRVKALKYLNLQAVHTSPASL